MLLPGNVVDQSNPTVGSHVTIHEASTSVLANQTELALILLMDRAQGLILLQVPGTKLNWRFHFGCRIELKNGNIVETDVSDILQSHGMALLPSHVRKAGTMLFSFPAGYDSMRVHVLEAAVDSSQATVDKVGGIWTKFGDIPYSEMWADDILWLPWFVEHETVTFEGHFIFDNGPGPNSQLVAHNCQRTDR